MYLCIKSWYLVWNFSWLQPLLYYALQAALKGLEDLSQQAGTPLIHSSSAGGGGGRTSGGRNGAVKLERGELTAADLKLAAADLKLTPADLKLERVEDLSMHSAAAAAAGRSMSQEEALLRRMSEEHADRQKERLRHHQQQQQQHDVDRAAYDGYPDAPEDLRFERYTTYFLHPTCTSITTFCDKVT